MKYLLALGLVGMAHAQCYNYNNDKDACCNTEGCGYQANGQCEEGDPVFLESAENICPEDDNPCDYYETNDFNEETLHVRISGDCGMGPRYYIILQAVGETRKIAYCEDGNGGPICKSDNPNLLKSDCNEGPVYQHSGNDYWQVSELCAMETSAKSGSSGPASCPKTVTAEFKGAVGISNYTVSIDGGPESFDPPITMCHGDTLKVTGTVFGGHPLQIWHDGASILQNSGDATLSEGEYTYECGYHPSMSGVITVLHSSNSECACGQEPPSDPGHQCDAQTCPTGFTKRSPLPETLGSFPVKECCRPLKKGCMTLDKVNYDFTAEVAGPCFDAYKSAQDKVDDFVGKTTFRGKRNVHKQHAKEDFYKKLAEGKTKRQAIREARAIMVEGDLSEKVKKRARGTVKIAVAINSGEDSCELGASDDNCASLDLAADRDDNETTILTTEDADGSWAVVVDGENIIVKQTKNSDGTFDMQCWNNSWGTATNYDVSDDTFVKTHKCHGRVFLLGSTQLACDDITCPEGCGDDGLCPSDSTEADSTAEVSSSNGTICNALRDSGNATAFIEGQCCNNC